MSSLIPFSFESHSVRAFNIDGTPWFVGKDVAEAQGYKNPADAITRHCKGVAKHYPLQTAGGTQDVHGGGTMNMSFVWPTVVFTGSTRSTRYPSSTSSKCRPVAQTVGLSASSPLYIKRKPLYTGLRSTHAILASRQARFGIDRNSRPVYASIHGGRHG